MSEQLSLGPTPADREPVYMKANIKQIMAEALARQAVRREAASE